MLKIIEDPDVIMMCIILFCVLFGTYLEHLHLLHSAKGLSVKKPDRAA